MIKISVPNDDEAALQYFGEAMIKLAASVRGEGPVDVRVEPITLKLDDEALARLQQATSDLMQAAPAMMRENDVDGSIEIHGKRKEEATHIITSEEKVGGPVDLGDGNFSQGYRIEVEELATTDSTNTPWDERIHSASKALNSDGTWRLRRKPKDMDEAEWSQFVDATLIEIMPDNTTDDMGQVVDKHISAAHQHVTEQYGQGLANAAFTGDRNTAPDSIITNALKVGEPVEVAEGEFSQAYVFKSEPPVTPAGDDFHVDAGEVTEQQIASIPVPPLPVPPVQQSDMTFPQVMQFLTERHGRITSAQVDQIIADMGLNSIMDLNTQPEHTGPFIARVKALLGE